MRSPVALWLALAALAPGSARAAARRFAWLWDTDALPERTVELEWWVTERTHYPDSAAVLTVATVVGVTDNLELAIPVEAVWRPDTNETQLSTYGIELHLRLADSDRAKAPPLVPFLRVAARRDIQLDAARLEANASASLDLGPALRVALDLGVAGATRGRDVAGTIAAGLSFAAIDELHLGVELFAELPISSDGQDDAWLTAGPDLAWVHGRFWLTAALPIGVTSSAPRFLPRVVWATAF